MQLQIRTAGLLDAKAIADIHIASMRAAYRNLIPAEELDRIDACDRAKRWRDQIAQGATTAVIAEVEREPLGFVAFGPYRGDDLPPGPVGELTALYVRPDVWGKDIGRRLMREALERLRASGVKTIVLWVLEGNSRAIGFYERLGFVRDGAVQVREAFGKSATIIRLRRDFA